MGSVMTLVMLSVSIGIVVRAWNARRHAAFETSPTAVR
jgi:hypothetical protein